MSKLAADKRSIFFLKKFTKTGVCKINGVVELLDCFSANELVILSDSA